MGILDNRFVKNKKNIWILLSIVILLLFIGIVFGSNIFSPQSGTEAQTVAVTRGTIETVVDGIGTVAAEPSAILLWETDGITANYDLAVGDSVKKGDILMELEPSSQPAETLQAQTSLLEAQAELDKLLVSDAQFQEVLKDLTYQEVMLIHKYNARDAWNYGGSSDVRVDAALAAYESAERRVWELEDAYQSVKSLDEEDPKRIAAYKALQEATLDRDILLRALNQILGHPYDLDVETDFIAYQQQVALVAETRASYKRYLDDSEEVAAARAEVQALQNTIDQARIIAPFVGTVTEIFVNPGEGVMADDKAIQMDDLDNLVIELSISQMEINKVRVGQEAHVVFEAVPNQNYQGFVQEIAAAGEEVDGQTQFTVQIQLENPDEHIKLGFTAYVEITTDQAENALLVPNQTLYYDDEGAVYVIRAGQNQSRIFIDTGVQSDVYTQIIKGELQEGDQLMVRQVEENNFEVGSGQAINAALRLQGNR